MRAYWAAWRELLTLTGEVTAGMAQIIAPCLLRGAALLLLLAWIFCIALLLAAGDYWEATGAFIGSLLLALLASGHVAARMIMRENSTARDDNDLAQ